MKVCSIQFLLVFTIGGLLSPLAFAEKKKVLIVGFGMDKPPYVFEKNDSGLEVEIFREAAHAAGYEVKSFYGPMERIKSMMIQGRLDAITNTNIKERLHFYNSAPFIEYHNYAIALKKKKLKINSISDLKKYSIVSFQRARDLLGDEYTKMVSGNSQYSEVADQKLRNIQLYKERIDVVIADKRIFEYFNTQLDRSPVYDQPVIIYDIFKINRYEAAFRSEAVMKKFNEGLSIIKKNGTYQKLEVKYSAYK